MQADLPKLIAHADAVDALFADNVHRLNALVEAQGTIVQYDRSPMREMALQGLAKAIVKGEALQGSLSPYTRTLRLYIAEIERNRG
ncbi:MAG: hypothetical protein K2Q20_00830 [Phycisphaerales bacterium]|nr:hypothetical protein [Phycisphaerales bacterium]